MFKTLLLVLGAGALLLVGSCVAFLVWAQRAGSEQQEKFFMAVSSGDPQKVLDLCDPGMTEQVDAPVLGAWMAEVQKQLGAYKAMSSTDFNTSMSSDDKGTVITSKGTVHFDKGDAQSDLTFTNGKLTAFEINSDKIKGDWFQGFSDTKLYRDRGEEFIRKFFSKDLAGATPMMHEELRKQAPDDKLKSMMEAVADAAGPVKSVKFLKEKFTTDDGQRLLIDYEVVGEKAKVAFTVKFTFVGLKGQLLGFDFQEE
ncbi:MAG: hypothetical protein C0483_23145 [Pirellula sp.]|nr:hypothetical protein [Pirellula sp.]